MKQRKVVKPENELTPITVYVTTFVLGVIGYFWVRWPWEAAGIRCTGRLGWQVFSLGT